MVQETSHNVTETPYHGEKERNDAILFLLTTVLLFTVLIYLFGIMGIIIGPIILIIGIYFFIGSITILEPGTAALLIKWDKMLWRTYGGVEVPVYLSEGWHFLLFKNFGRYSLKIVSVISVNFDPVPQELTTPDNATSNMFVSFAFKVDKNNILNYILRGGETGIIDQLKDNSEQTFRIWARSPLDGPMTWEELQASGKETLAMLIEKICGDTLEQIHSEIPVSVLISYFANADPENKRIRVKWGDGKSEGDFDTDKWRILGERLLRLPTKDVQDLKQKSEKRRKIATELSNGKGEWKIEKLGIILQKLNITDIKPFGKIYEESLKIKQEEIQRKFETYEIKTDLAKAEIMLEAYRKSGNHTITLEDCINQNMNWKIMREGKGGVYSGSLGGVAALGNILNQSK